MGGVEVDLIPGNGVLTIELKVYDLQLDFAANFNGSSIRGDVNAHPAIIRLGLRIDTDGLGGLDLSIVNAEAEMEDFDFDVNGLLGLFDSSFEFLHERINIFSSASCVAIRIFSASTVIITAEV